MYQNSRHIELVLHNIRSAHNVGALFRTADGLGISHIYLSGYTPYPMQSDDSRLPHIAKKTDAAIAKTALGAEQTVSWSNYDDLNKVVAALNNTNVPLIALEQDPDAITLHQYQAPDKFALLVGNEVSGLNKVELSHCDHAIVIPMLGNKESYNVASAGAMALHWLRFC